MNAKHAGRKATKPRSVVGSKNPSDELPSVETKLQIGRERDSRNIIHTKSGYVLDKPQQ